MPHEYEARLAFNTCFISCIKICPSENLGLLIERKLCRLKSILLALSACQEAGSSFFWLSSCPFFGTASETMTDLRRWCAGGPTATRRAGGPRRRPPGRPPPSGTQRRAAPRQGTPPRPPATLARSFARLHARTASARPPRPRSRPAGSRPSPASALPAPTTFDRLRGWVRVRV